MNLFEILVYIVVAIAAIILIILFSSHKAAQNGERGPFEVSGNGKDVSFWASIMLFLYLIWIVFNTVRGVVDSALRIGHGVLFVFALIVSIVYGTQDQKSQGDQVILSLVWVLWFAFLLIERTIPYDNQTAIPTPGWAAGTALDPNRPPSVNRNRISWRESKQNMVDFYNNLMNHWAKVNPSVARRELDDLAWMKGIDFKASLFGKKKRKRRSYKRKR